MARKREQPAESLVDYFDKVSTDQNNLKDYIGGISQHPPLARAILEYLAGVNEDEIPDLLGTRMAPAILELPRQSITSRVALTLLKPLAGKSERAATWQSGIEASHSQAKSKAEKDFKEEEDKRHKMARRILRVAGKLKDFPDILDAIETMDFDRVEKHSEVQTSVRFSTPFVLFATREEELSVGSLPADYFKKKSPAEGATRATLRIEDHSETLGSAVMRFRPQGLLTRTQEVSIPLIRPRSEITLPNGETISFREATLDQLTTMYSEEIFKATGGTCRILPSTISEVFYEVYKSDTFAAKEIKALIENAAKNELVHALFAGQEGPIMVSEYFDGIFPAGSMSEDNPLLLVKDIVASGIIKSSQQLNALLTAACLNEKELIQKVVDGDITAKELVSVMIEQHFMDEDGHQALTPGQMSNSPHVTITSGAQAIIGSHRPRVPLSRVMLLFSVPVLAAMADRKLEEFKQALKKVGETAGEITVASAERTQHMLEGRLAILKIENQALVGFVEEMDQIGPELAEQWQDKLVTQAKRIIATNIGSVQDNMSSSTSLLAPGESVRE